MEITKMLTIFNGHVTDETWQMLAKEASAECGIVLPMTVFAKGEYGFFVCCEIMDHRDDIELVPDDLLACMNLAHENGCTWLCLDDDGLTVPGLTLY